ncbi:hypothetical protein PsorP6_010544 [Peronosclerospora sorghi]|uniref:Uncharacterized protein n=1 Tax=Peronosclerospora sorghi TaxID=230839 RepID=A0ACC0VYL7_9STRA|nr:hypothetical protein PsorP6_010544 [Peronosclerospora sorghi]
MYPDHDARVTLLKIELWCNRVLSGDKEKADNSWTKIPTPKWLYSCARMNPGDPAWIEARYQCM